MPCIMPQSFRKLLELCGHELSTVVRPYFYWGSNVCEKLTERIDQTMGRCIFIRKCHYLRPSIELIHHDEIMTIFRAEVRVLQFT